ncbi:MAG: hypothetical protein C4293_13410 [Nitrospiraceae bacterium]
MFAMAGAVVAARGSAPTPDPPAMTNGVTVSGRVSYVGEIPAVEQTPVDRDRSFCGETMPNEALSVGRESRGVAAVVVSLEGVPKGKTRSEDRPLVLENRTCRFVPRISAALAGAVLVVRNADPILHNTHIRKKPIRGKFVKRGAAPRGRVEKVAKEAGLLDVRCDAHPFMHGAIHVFNHPYFAVTDSTGRFELNQVPPGKYRLKIWHETLRSQEQMITVTSDAPVFINLEVGPEAA